MRPLILGVGWFPDQLGGLNRYLRCLHQALQEAGQAPTTVVVGPVDHPPSSVRAASRTDAPLLTRLISYAAAARRAGTAAGVVDAHFALYGALPVMLPGLRKLPLVVHFQGPWAAESQAVGQQGLRLGAKAAVERLVYRRADLLIVLCPAFKKTLVADYGIAPWRIHILPPGVDVSWFTPGDRAEARARLGVDQAAWVALAVRRLVPRMGIDVLLTAWADVARDRPHSVLLLAGDGPARKDLEEQAARLDTSGVRFLGAVDEEHLRHAYRAADVSVVPTLALEGFGLVTLESLACGTPTIVSEVDGLSDVPARLDPSTVVPPGDTEALAKRLCQAADGSKPLPGADACRELASSFSWSGAAERHIALYRGLAKGSDRRLRVVYLDHVARLSGGELSLLRLLPALTEVDAHVILAEQGPLVARLEDAGVSVEVLSMGSRARGLPRKDIRLGSPPVGTALVTMAYVVRLARRLRVLRPDLVHTNSLKAAVYGGLAARLAGVKVVWHVRDRIAPDYLPPAAVRLMHMLLPRLPHAVIANSAATLATFGAEIRLGYAIPNIVAISDIVAGPAPNSPQGRWSHQDGDKVFRVGMVGRLTPWKGQDVFLRAFASAFGGEAAVRAVLVGGALFGEHDYERRLHDLVADLGVAEQVDFLGHCDDMDSQLRSIDVLVHASVIPEPFGQVVVEGMAAGLPVMASAMGGPTEIITHDVDGLLVPPGDVGAMSAALRRLRSDDELRARLGRTARRHVGRYAAEPISAQVMEVYRSLSGPDSR